MAMVKRARSAQRRRTQVEKSIVIDRSPEELFEFWRNFENLPLFMRHLERVTVRDPIRSHWVLKGPMNVRIEWDADVTNDQPSEMIAWQSIEGSDVNVSGSVHFDRIPESGGTRVRLVMRYDPPAGKLGAIAARLSGHDPERFIQEDMERLKHLMETGAISGVADSPR